jgi:ferrous iron transport protein B
VVVGALDTIYTRLGMEAEPDKPAAFDLRTAFGEAAATVSTNLGEVAHSLLDPLGMNIGDISSSQIAAKEQGINHDTFGAMASRFDGKIGAFAYLLFILLYFPCVATIGAISREAGFGWAMFVGAWTTGVAYTVATTFYQAATLSALAPG